MLRLEGKRGIKYAKNKKERITEKRKQKKHSSTVSFKSEEDEIRKTADFALLNCFWVSFIFESAHKKKRVSIFTLLFYV